MQISVSVSDQREYSRSGWSRRRNYPSKDIRSRWQSTGMHLTHSRVGACTYRYPFPLAINGNALVNGLKVRGRACKYPFPLAINENTAARGGPRRNYPSTDEFCKIMGKFNKKLSDIHSQSILTGPQQNPLVLASPQPTLRKFKSWFFYPFRNTPASD